MNGIIKISTIDICKNRRMTHQLKDRNKIPQTIRTILEIRKSDIMKINTMINLHIMYIFCLFFNF